MSTIVTRQGKGTPLLFSEVDQNFINLNNDKTENANAAITGGSINGASIGGTTASTGKFTTLTATTALISETTLQVNGNTTLDGDLLVKGGDITTNQTTFNLLNSTATTLNIGGAATTINIGANTGTLTFHNTGVVHSSTSYLKLPVGTSGQRPGSPAEGMVRYNSEISSFEGYASGAWSSLGGVKSVDGLTYIIAETSAGASNDELEFYAATGSLSTSKVGGWNQTRLLVNTDLTVGGNLTVNGTTFTINSTTLTVDDKNIELGSVASPTDITADGGGITLKGTTDKTFNWVDATDAWTSSEHLNLLTGKAYYINGTSVLNSTTLGSGVTGSSLTSVGTLTSLTVSGNLIVDTNTLYVDSTNNRVGIGTSSPTNPLNVSASSGRNAPLVTIQSVGATGGGGNNDVGLLVDISAYAGNTSALNVKSASTSRFWVGTDGNVGIGTTNPSAGSAKLNVYGTSGNIRIRAESTGTTSSDSGEFFAVGGSYFTQVIQQANGNAALFGNSTQLLIGSSAAANTLFYTNNAERMRIDSSGRVAIGTSSPGSATTFTVKAGDSTGTNPGTGVFYKYFGTAASPTESLDWPTPVLCLRGFGNFTQESMLSFGYSNDADYQTGNAVWAFRLDGVSSATTSSASTHLRLIGPGTFYVDSSIVSSGTVTANSDERYKHKWETLPANFVTNLATVKSGTYEKLDNEQRQAGVSAQSLQELLPETVVADKEGILSVAYGNAALVSAIELAKEVVKLKELVNNLQLQLQEIRRTQ